MVPLGDEAQVQPRFCLSDIVLILTQDRCTVCVERTIGSKIILDAPDRLLGDVGHGNLSSFHLETVLVSVQDRCMVCTRHRLSNYFGHT